MTNPIVDQMIGRTIAQYEILARRGGGGMGVVYEARDTKLGRRVALKFLPPQWSHDEAAKQRFVREAQAASATDHPNICTIHDIGAADDGQLFIVMAYYEGETLKQRLARGPLPLHDALDVATQVADGLAKAHANGVVHRDIKPGNIILTEDGVRIVDFGLATFADALQLTVPGSTLGTAAYMSPEQARGEEADARADVWAVGVILYEMLAGHVPFRGAYAEAIAYAIRNDPPAPLRDERPEVPEDVEQLVFRALHKDPAIRYQNGRELARALRQACGFTVPLDLRTQAIDIPPDVRVVPPRRRVRLLWGALATAFMLSGVPAAWWWSRPPARLPVVIAPVVNQSGYGELDGYRMAMTLMMIDQLADAPSIRVMPHQRVLAASRRTRGGERDLSSTAALRQLARHTGARWLVVPTLTYSDRDTSWRIHVEVQRPETGTAEFEFDTAPLIRALKNDAAYDLTQLATRRIAEYFARYPAARGYVLDTLAQKLGFTEPTRPLARTLEAAAAFERGLDAFDQQEFDVALAAFTAASQQDTGNPLLLAWRSRAARMMRHEDVAVESAQQAGALLAADTSQRVRLFSEAVRAEADRNYAKAAEYYRKLMAAYPDENAWALEYAALLDRQTESEAAIVEYQRVLTADPMLVRPELELCRLYNRVNDPARARGHARSAIDKYEDLGDIGGEGQALLCLTDTLRVGGAAELSEAKMAASRALELFSSIESSYNVARAHHYVALIGDAQGELADAAAHWQEALTLARKVGNRTLEATVLMNLGVTHERLGNRVQAFEFYKASHALHASLGNERGGAYSQANVGALLIASGDTPEEGFREVQNALEVVRKLGDRSFEVFARRAAAAYHLHAGRLDDAERELAQAEGIARDRQLKDEISFVTSDLARVRIERGRTADARDLLLAALEHASGPSATEMRVVLARAYQRLGDTHAAERALGKAEAGALAGGDTVFLPALYLVWGDTRYDARDVQGARRFYMRSASFWIDALPDPAAVEATARLALLDALAGNRAMAVAAATKSLEQAVRMQHRTLEMRCRIVRARIELEAGRPGAALAVIPSGLVAPDPEVQAQVHHWRAEALAKSGKTAAASEEAARARAIIERLLSSVPPADRARAAGRQYVGAVVG